MIFFISGDILQSQEQFIAQGVATGLQEGLGTGLALKISKNNMRLMQAEQFIFHSRKCCKFGLRFLPLAVIENALPASISKTLYTIK
jgi:hypothetical protein